MRASGQFLSLTSCKKSQFLFFGPRISSVGSGSICFFLQFKSNIDKIKYNLESTFFKVNLIFLQEQKLLKALLKLIVGNIIMQMKKPSYLTENQKKVYLNPQGKSKSPFGNFNKTPPKNVFKKTPPKNYPLMGITFSAKQQNKTSVLYGPKVQNNNSKISRNLTLELYDVGRYSDVDNIEEKSNTHRSLKFFEDQYFRKTMAKVSQIRSRYNTNHISKDLNEVLNMIKQQKLKINEKMKILKRNNEYYRKLCEGERTMTFEQGTNAIEILNSGMEKFLEHKETQVNPEEAQAMKSIRKSQKAKGQEKCMGEKVSQTYVKVYSMLEDMGIDYHQILPESPIEIPQSGSKNYKHLSEGQVIKIQRFFIQKLSSKLTPLILLSSH